MTEPTDDEMREWIRTHKLETLGRFLWQLPYLILVFLGGVVEGAREEWARQRGKR